MRPVLEAVNKLSPNLASLRSSHFTSEGLGPGCTKAQLMLKRACCGRSDGH
jgi:hypothetical protein